MVGVYRLMASRDDNAIHLALRLPLQDSVTWQSVGIRCYYVGEFFERFIRGVCAASPGKSACRLIVFACLVPYQFPSIPRMLVELAQVFIGFAPV